MAATAPAAVEGVRTLVIPTNAHAVDVGSAPLTPLEANLASAQTLPAAVLSQAVAVKQKLAHNLDSAESGLLRRRRWPKPRQSKRCSAGHLCGIARRFQLNCPQPSMASAPATFSWTTARDEVLRRADSIQPSLHAPPISGPAGKFRSPQPGQTNISASELKISEVKNKPAAGSFQRLICCSKFVALCKYP